LRCGDCRRRRHGGRGGGREREGKRCGIEACLDAGDCLERNKGDTIDPEEPVALDVHRRCRQHGGGDSQPAVLGRFDDADPITQLVAIERDRQRPLDPEWNAPRRCLARRQRFRIDRIDSRSG
jgi:hypothetical protein